MVHLGLFPYWSSTPLFVGKPTSYYGFHFISSSVAFDRLKVILYVEPNIQADCRYISAGLFFLQNRAKAKMEVLAL